MDYVAILGVLVAILSILVTVLLVWQVIASMNIERTINRRIRNAVHPAVKNLEDRIKSEVSSSKADILLTMAMAKKEEWGRNDFTLAMEALMIALANGTDNIDLCIHYVLHVYKDERHEMTPAMYEDARILIMESKIGSEDKKKLMDFLSNQDVLGFDSM